jgi:hypothetical protein
MSTGERSCWITAVVGASLVAAPFVSDSYASALKEGAYALMFVGAIAGLSGFCLVFFFRSRDRHRRQLLAGQGVRARWSYTAAEWKAFSGIEVVRQSTGMRWLLGITAVFMVLATLGKMSQDRDAGLFVGAVMLVTWIICWLVAHNVVKKFQRRAEGPALDVLIGQDAMLVGDELHVWRGWGNLLHSCTVVEGPPRQLKIIYSVQGRNNRPITDVQVPIPAGREAEAQAIVASLSG